MKTPEFTWFKTLDWPKLAKITFCLILAYIVIIFSIGLFKYFNFLYNGLDLAIFNQVFYNSSFGRLFEFSIHPTSYLGDHFELIIFFLLPFYTVWRSPLNLILIQACFLGFTAIPIYLLAKKHLTPQLGLAIILLYLFNPLTYNIALYEFHILALAPFFLAWTFYFYDQNKFWSFLAFCGLSLLVREDVSFVIFLFGLIALLDRKKLKWILTPSISAALYFLVIMKLATYVSSLSSYKFLVYYYWLGNSPSEIVLNFFLKFPLVIQHTATIQNLELILGLFLVFLFIPLWRPKYLILCLGTLIQLLLASLATVSVIKGHYGAIYLIIFTITSIFSLQALSTNKTFLHLNKIYSGVLPLIFIGSLAYIFIIFGPLPNLFKTIIDTDYRETKIKAQIVNSIPKSASLITSYDLITNLSSRQRIYSLNYVVLGRQQFNAGDYTLPDNTEYLLINFTDFVTFHLQYSQKYREFYIHNSSSIKTLLKEKNFKLKKISQNLALWEKSDTPANFELYTIFDKNKSPIIDHPRSQNLENKLVFSGYSLKENKTTLYFKALDKLNADYFIKINNKLYPLGYGFIPTTTWPADQIIALIFFDLGKITKAEIISFDGAPSLNGIASISWDFDRYEVIGDLQF